MGMHAGWLALSSSLGHPDFIIIPEFPLDYERLKEKIIDKYRAQRNVIIVAAEGSRWKSGIHISASEEEKDSFGHPKFKGAAETLAKKLKEDLKKLFDTRNVNSVNPSYLYRAGKPNELDYKTSLMLGKEAINILSGNLSEPVFLTLEFRGNDFGTKEFYLKKLSNIEDFHRFVDNKFYDAENYMITNEGSTYLSKIIRELPMLDYSLQK
jgi:6-phosphofructokinase 1